MQWWCICELVGEWESEEVTEESTNNLQTKKVIDTMWHSGLLFKLLELEFLLWIRYLAFGFHEMLGNYRIA
jgi:hypothetical protein